MSRVAPLIRRPVVVAPEGTFPELGVRSFGKGTFHKPELSGAEVGTKKLFRVEAGDLIFNIVFAWEGAVAVARADDRNRVGSHRFLTCVADPASASAVFLRYYFLTNDGLTQLGNASPGGAGRNRTLGLEALANIQVPAPEPAKRMWFDRLQASAEKLRNTQAAAKKEVDALMPAILDRAFRGEL